MSEATHSEIALDLASRFLDCRPHRGVINFNSNCSPGHQCNHHLNEDLESAEADAERLAGIVKGFGYNCGCKGWHLHDCGPKSDAFRAECEGDHACDEDCAAAREALRAHQGQGV